MFKKKMLTGMVLGLVATLPTYAAEGVDGGNGGLAYVCRDTQGAITQARLLDLWEPEGVKPEQDYSTPYEALIEKALNKIKSFDQRTADALKELIFQASVDVVWVKKRIPLTNDAIPEYLPEPGCDFEQVARYGWVNETQNIKLRINEEIFNSPAFSNSDRAALYIHEAVYARSKKLIPAITNSLDTRSMVSALFSDHQLSSKNIIYLVFLMNGVLSRDSSSFVFLTGNEIEAKTFVAGGKANYTIFKNDEVVGSGSLKGKRDYIRHDDEYILMPKDQIRIEFDQESKRTRLERRLCVRGNTIQLQYPQAIRSWIGDDGLYNFNNGITSCAAEGGSVRIIRVL